MSVELFLELLLMLPVLGCHDVQNGIIAIAMTVIKMASPL